MKVAGIAFIVVAAALLVWGLEASDSIQSGFSRFFRGSPTDKTVWLLAASAGAGVMGLGLLFSSKNRVE